jgi:asparagine synthase (glutamine-hydrolysing)
MDSSSIVCMADLLLDKGAASTPRLDTISYYSDIEPNWDERPYFTRVEEKRAQIGCHIDARAEEPALFSENDGFAASPGSLRHQSKARRQFATFVQSRGSRVILSGTGGDEVLGGVPEPAPLLADLIITASFRSFVIQLTAWSVSKRKPAVQLLREAIEMFLSSPLARVMPERRPPLWLRADFAKRNNAALLGYRTPLRFNGVLPSFQDNVKTFAGLRRQLGCITLASQPPMEKRYPFLDRTLLEFLYAIPQDQLLRPGQRRSLMRRALIDIVPTEILNRKRKAFVARGPLRAIAAQAGLLLEISEHMISDHLGIVDPEQFRDAIKRAQCGLDVQLVPLLRTIGIERWLRSVDGRQIQAETKSVPYSKPTAIGNCRGGLCFARGAEPAGR